MEIRFRNPVIDRIWLGLVGFAFVTLAPLLLIVWSERLGWRFVAGSLALALTYRWQHRSAP